MSDVDVTSHDTLSLNDFKYSQHFHPITLCHFITLKIQSIFSSNHIMSFNLSPTFS